MKNLQRQSLLKLILAIFFLIVLAFTLIIKRQVSAEQSMSENQNRNDLTVSTSSTQMQESRATQIINSPIFTEFNDLLKLWAEGNFRGSDEQMKSAALLAVQRRDLFKELIEISPKLAVQMSISNTRANASLSENKLLS